MVDPLPVPVEGVSVAVGVTAAAPEQYVAAPAVESPLEVVAGAAAEVSAAALAAAHESVPAVFAAAGSVEDNPLDRLRPQDQIYRSQVGEDWQGRDCCCCSRSQDASSCLARWTVDSMGLTPCRARRPVYSLGLTPCRARRTA